MSDHWYGRDGRPAYSQITREGRERPTDLRDARKQGLLPSVTTVLQVISKPQLTEWMIDQGIMAALTLQRQAGESDYAFLGRIREDGKAQATKAADEGSRIHDAVECSFKGRPFDPTYSRHVDATRARLADLFPEVKDWRAEESFGSADGYGGKVDVFSPSWGIVVDFKGKDGDFTDGKRLAYDQHWQLAAYQKGLGLPPARCANIFVSRTHPGAVAHHVWSLEDMAHGWEVFQAALKLWKLLKKYDPSFSKE